MIATRTQRPTLAVSILTLLADLFAGRSHTKTYPTRPKAPQIADLVPGPRDCVLVIDGSYSMDTDDWLPSRLGAAQDASHAYIRRLGADVPGSRVAIVGYGSRAKVFCPLVPIRDRAPLNAAIDSINTLGSTNIRAGLDPGQVKINDFVRRCGKKILEMPWFPV